MPTLSVIEKGIHASSLDNNKEKKKEPRCYFGLLSLRQGIIAHASISAMLMVALGLTTTREELADSKLPFLFDIYIPIPFTNRGITSLTLYHSLTPFIGLYGAYKRSPQAINISKILTQGDIAWGAGYVTIGNIKIAAMIPLILNDETMKAIAASPDPPTGLLRFGYKYCGLLFAIVSVAITATEIYALHIKYWYHETLLIKEENEKPDDAYCGCFICKLF